MDYTRLGTRFQPSVEKSHAGREEVERESFGSNRSVSLGVSAENRGGSTRVERSEGGDAAVEEAVRIGREGLEILSDLKASLTSVPIVECEQTFVEDVDDVIKASRSEGVHPLFVLRFGESRKNLFGEEEGRSESCRLERRRSRFVEFPNLRIGCEG
jgi:hypothetical protein